MADLPKTTKTNTKKQKFLTFKLSREIYGIEILRVQEIVGFIETTPVPQTPGYVKGVVNLRGHVIPVIDLRVKFDLEPVEPDDETCIIIAIIKQDGKEICTGLLVDKVREVIDIPIDDIQECSGFGNLCADFLLGMAKINDYVAMLLNIESVIESNKADMLSSI